MIQFQKWDYSPNLTGDQVWSAVFEKTIESESGVGSDVVVTTAYSADQLEDYLMSPTLDEETHAAMYVAVREYHGEPARLAQPAAPSNVVHLKRAA